MGGQGISAGKPWPCGPSVHLVVEWESPVLRCSQRDNNVGDLNVGDF